MRLSWRGGWEGPYEPVGETSGGKWGWFLGVGESVKQKKTVILLLQLRKKAK